MPIAKVNAVSVGTDGLHSRNADRLRLSNRENHQLVGGWWRSGLLLPARCTGTTGTQRGRAIRVHLAIAPFDLEAVVGQVLERCGVRHEEIAVCKHSPGQDGRAIASPLSKTCRRRGEEGLSKDNATSALRSTAQSRTVPLCDKALHDRCPIAWPLQERCRGSARGLR